MPEMTIPNAAASFVHNIIQRPPVSTALSARWIAAGPEKTRRQLGLAMSQQKRRIASPAIEHHLHDKLGRRVAAGHAAVCSNDPQFLHMTPLTKALAVLTIGQLGDRKNVSQLEPLLDERPKCAYNPRSDSGPAGNFGRASRRRLSRHARLLPTNRPPITVTQPHGCRLPAMFQLQTLYRENERQRAEAVAKWREWESAHKAELRGGKDAAPAAATPLQAK